MAKDMWRTRRNILMVSAVVHVEWLGKSSAELCVICIGFGVSGTIPTGNPTGVHSLQDVPVYAKGPGSEAFRGVCE